jgi:hypothetical protein
LGGGPAIGLGANQSQRLYNITTAAAIFVDKKSTNQEQLHFTESQQKLKIEYKEKPKPYSGQEFVQY